MNLLTENFFPLLSDVHHAIAARLDKADALPVNLDWVSNTFASGVSYGTTVCEHSPLASLKGRPTGKYAHAIVTRMESGRYELIFYVF